MTSDEIQKEVRLSIGQVVEQYALERVAEGHRPGIIGADLSIGLIGALRDWLATREATISLLGQQSPAELSADLFRRR